MVYFMNASCCPHESAFSQVWCIVCILAAKRPFFDTIKIDEGGASSVVLRSRGTLVFSDGAYDLASGELGPVTRERAGLLACPRPCPGPGTPDALKLVNSLLDVIMPVPAERAALLHVIARAALGGHVEDRNFIVLTGKTSNGKTTLARLLRAALAPLVAQFTGAWLASKHSSDPERANAWLTKLEGARLAISDEITVSTLNSNNIKSVSKGGGEELEARRLYKDSGPCAVSATLMLLVNDFPDFHPPDDALKRRLLQFHMRTTFLKAGDPRLESSEKFLAVEDPRFSDAFFAEVSVRDALFHVLAEAYRSPVDLSHHRASANAAVDGDPEPERPEDARKRVLSEIFDFTGKGDDLLPHKIIHQAIKAHKADCTWSSVQIFKTLEVLGAKMGKEKWFTKPDGINKFKEEGGFVSFD